MSVQGQTRLFPGTESRPVGPKKRKVWDGHILPAALRLLLPFPSKAHTAR